MNFPLADFEAFCGRLSITSRDEGVVPLTWRGPQRLLAHEIARGLEEGVHDFLVYKGGRQIGGSTFCLALTAYWHMKYSGVQGMTVTEDDENRQYFRDLFTEMVASLPVSHRRRTRVDNRGIYRWDNNSRLMFQHAGKAGRLGRSRGLNYRHGTELSSWQDAEGYDSLLASCSTTHPRRLYIDETTPRGFGLFYDLWKTAQRAKAQRAIFLGWWLMASFRITPTEAALWDAYGAEPPTGIEREKIEAVARRYGVAVDQEQLAWSRWQLEEKFRGDEALCSQEFPWLPEDGFQSFGLKFIAPATIQRMRLALERVPEPLGYRYDFGGTLDASSVAACDLWHAPLLVWEQPEAAGVYVISADPAYGSSERADSYCIQVWRAWPDALVQVAEYCTPVGTTYQFAWVCLHLCGAYNALVPPWFILELTGPGYAVMEELDRIQNYGFGLSATAYRQRGRELVDMLASINHYLYRRPDSFASSVVRQWKMGANRPWLMSQLRDTVERGALECRSAGLVDELAALRRGEQGDNDRVEAGGGSHDDRAICAALACRDWMERAVPELGHLLTPKEPPKGAPANVTQATIQQALARFAGGGSAR